MTAELHPPLEFLEADGTRRKLMWSHQRRCYIATDNVVIDLRAQVDAAHEAMDSARHYLRKLAKYERCYRPEAAGKSSAA